jgi:hypothetical protein
MSDRESVLAANRAFYDAFESLDAEKMEAVWLRDPRIICIHPELGAHPRQRIRDEVRARRD